MHLHPILLYGIKENVKVCNRCSNELNAENAFFSMHLPMLLAGEKFIKPTMMGLGTKVVELRLFSDQSVLTYDEIQHSSKSTEIILDTIKRIKISGLTSFVLVTEDKKSYEFEADSAITQRKWTDAIRLIVERHSNPTLKQRILKERREITELKYKEVDSANRQRVAETAKANRQNKLGELKNKYNRK